MQSNKKIKLLILNPRKDKHLKNPKFSSGYKDCYDYFSSLAMQENLDVFKSSFDYLDRKKMKFNFGWKFQNGKWSRVSNIKPDVVYYKESYSSDKTKKLDLLEQIAELSSSKEFGEIFSNKFTTYLFFPQFLVESFLIKNKQDIIKNLPKIKTRKIVLKPTFEAGGFGIEILNKTDASKFKPKIPMVMQRFIDTSKGVKGLVKGVHDLRVVMIGEKILHAYFRLAKQGSFFANLHQGGTKIHIKNNQIPKSVQKIISQVNHKLKYFPPSIFSIDFFFDSKGKPYIIEFNPNPGIHFLPENKKLQTKIYLEMINFFKQIALETKK